MELVDEEGNMEGKRCWEAKHMKKRKILDRKSEDTLLGVGIMDFSSDHTLPLVITGPLSLCAMS